MVVKTEGESCTVLELSSLEHLPSRATLELVTLSQPFVLQAWDMQCRGPVRVAEDALQGHRIRALTRSGFIVLYKCRRRLLSPWQRLWSLAPEDVLHTRTAASACKDKGTPTLLFATAASQHCAWLQGRRPPFGTLSRHSVP